MNDEDEMNDIESVMTTTEQGRTDTLTLRTNRRITTAHVILELGYLDSEMVRAEAYLKQPDSVTH